MAGAAVVGGLDEGMDRGGVLGCFSGMRIEGGGAGFGDGFVTSGGVLALVGRPFLVGRGKCGLS